MLITVSLEPLRRHPAQLIHIIGMHHIRINNSRLPRLLHRLLRNLYPVIHNKQRIVGPQHLVIERNPVQILLQQRLQHLVILTQSLALLLYRQQVQQHLVATQARGNQPFSACLIPSMSISSTSTTFKLGMFR